MHIAEAPVPPGNTLCGLLGIHAVRTQLSQVEYVVASNHDLSEHAIALSILDLLGVGELYRRSERTCQIGKVVKMITSCPQHTWKFM